MIKLCFERVILFLLQDEGQREMAGYCSETWWSGPR